MRSIIAVVLVVAACGTDPDTRPVTFEVITYEVLQPSCGTSYCHSSITRTADLAFDTLESTRASLQGGEFGHVLTVIGDKSMPPDSPIDPRDTALLQAWVDAGTPGL